LFQQADYAEKAMRESIEIIEKSIKNIRPDIKSIWSTDLKASDEVLIPILHGYFKRMNRSAQIQKSRFHELIPFMKPEEVDTEIVGVLDSIQQTASSANVTL